VKCASKGFTGLKTNIFRYEDGKIKGFSPGFGTPFEPGLNVEKHIVRGVNHHLSVMREAAGPEMDILLDLNFNAKTEGYLRFLRGIAEQDLFWVEIDTLDPQALAYIRSQSPHPIASCETLIGVQEFLPFLRAQAIDVAIVDTPWNGVWQSMKIAAAAEAHEVNVACHNFYGHRRRCADHRRRARLGAARTRLEPGRHQDAHRLCLEQGDWMNPSGATTPARAATGRPASSATFSSARNRRGPADYPINEDDSPINRQLQRGGRRHRAVRGALPAFASVDFKVRTLDGVADDWPIDYATLEPYFALNDRMMGVSGLAGDPAYPPKAAVMPPVPLGKMGDHAGRGLNAGLALVALRQRDRHPGLRRPRPCINLGHCIPAARRAPRAAPTSPTGRWPSGAGVELRTRCRVRRDHHQRQRHGHRRGVLRRRRRGAFPAAEVVILACNGVGTPRLLLNSRRRASRMAWPIPAAWSART
jgi:hypothetical protein